MSTELPPIQPDGDQDPSLLRIPTPVPELDLPDAVLGAPSSPDLPTGDPREISDAVLQGPDEDPLVARARMLRKAQAARRAGALLHEFMDQEQYPGLTQLLAECAGIFTSTTPRYPGSLAKVIQARGTAAQHDTLVHNTVENLTGMDGYAGLDRREMAIALHDALRPTKINVVNPGVELGGPVGGTIFAEQIELTVGARDGEDEASRRRREKVMAVTLQALFSAPYHTYPVLLEAPAEGGTHEVVVIKNGPTEYDIRGAGNVTGLTVAKYHPAMEGVTMEEKTPLQVLLDAGHTFPPAALAFMQEVGAHYQGIEVEVTFVRHYERPDGTEEVVVEKRLVTKERALASEATGKFQAERDALREDIENLRGGSHLNLEFDWRVRRRLNVLAGTDLIRDRVGPDGVLLGPVPAHAPYLSDKARAWARTTIEDARRHPVRAAAQVSLKLLGKIIGGAQDFAIEALQHVPGMSDKAKRLSDDARAWVSQRKEALAVGPRIDRALVLLLEETETRIRER